MSGGLGSYTVSAGPEVVTSRTGVGLGFAATATTSLAGTTPESRSRNLSRIASRSSSISRSVLFRITIDRFLDAVSQYAQAVAQEAQFKTTYNISIVALEEPKGTLLAYNNIAVATCAAQGVPVCTAPGEIVFCTATLSPSRQC